MLDPNERRKAGDELAALARVAQLEVARPRPNIIPINNPVHDSIADNLASAFYKRLVKWIGDFDNNLDAEHEVGVRLVSFGQTVVFHLESIGYWNPSLICFRGKTETDEPVELIQHVTQISVLLMKLPRREPDKPKRKIGFHVPPDAQPSQD